MKKRLVTSRAFALFSATMCCAASLGGSGCENASPKTSLKGASAAEASPTKIESTVSKERKTLPATQPKESVAQALTKPFDPREHEKRSWTWERNEKLRALVTKVITDPEELQAHVDPKRGCVVQADPHSWTSVCQDHVIVAVLEHPETDITERNARVPSRGVSKLIREAGIWPKSATDFVCEKRLPVCVSRHQYFVFNEDDQLLAMGRHGFTFDRGRLKKGVLAEKGEYLSDEQLSNFRYTVLSVLEDRSTSCLTTK